MTTTERPAGVPSIEELRELSRGLMVDMIAMESFADDPFVLVEGKGIRVRDASGRWYIDGLSGVFTSSYGHGNERLAGAAAEQARKLAFGMPLYAANLQTLQLADRLLEVAPGGYAVAKFTESGSAATESAMKMARQWHHLEGRGRRFKVLSHYRSYHGSTGHSLAASGGVAWRAPYEPFAPGFIHLHPPFVLQRRLGLSEDAAADAAIQLLEETIELEDPETIAAFITEPVMLSAGVRVAPRTYLPRVHEILRRHRILLIFDEIITGFGRTGRLFAAEHVGTYPDILCFGKGISGGYAALAGLMVQPHVAGTFWGRDGENREFRDGHTYGNNPIAGAVGLKAIEYLVDDRLIEHAARQGERLATRLRDGLGDVEAVTEVRGLGMLRGIALDGGAAGKPGAEPLGPKVSRAARERGLVVRGGLDFVALGPPLVSTDEEIDEIADIAIAAVRAVAAA